ncbi:DUF4870 domain-containing protein [Salinimicrobium oceani]|uniref:DUF4870 domain-containing protein n=1 Tax=Salinimicrobium oceani TaxID=2722702 RepID=A0ABX1D1W4_9FLAO|nr:DUF4870 domain-containing protein [Salinimicrobium oceani]NJW53312.1 DUF4870 domain-containing protein [Salinimicrobium oceani]
MEYSSNQGKAPAIIAYLTIIGTIIAYFMNNDEKDPFASFHIRQALGIHITFYLLGIVVSWFDSWFISAPFYLFIIVLWGYGLIAAIQGERNEVPILGRQFQNWFSTIN